MLKLHSFLPQQVDVLSIQYMVYINCHNLLHADHTYISSSLDSSFSFTYISWVFGGFFGLKCFNNSVVIDTYVIEKIQPLTTKGKHLTN